MELHLNSLIIVIVAIFIGLMKDQSHASLLALLSAFYALIYALVIHRVNFTPPVLELNAPNISFSEARAMRHITALAAPLGVVKGNRQVSSPGLDRATRYMIDAANAVKSEVEQLLAASNSPHLLTAEVHVETVSGASSLDFTSPPIKINFTNVYVGLDNVALVLRPSISALTTGNNKPKALLICSHYDGPVASYGAADDASQVAVMLETARTLIHIILQPNETKRRTLDAPVVFLWTGGEEPISPAAHGWFNDSPLAKEIGAFINLEAMGGGGMPILFQHTGAWTPRAWGKGAPHARGSRVAQDIFDANALPADSDYRMFSGRHYGSLPGIDVAYVFDSLTYHSYLDETSRIKRGTIQEMGENLLGAIFSFTEHLVRENQESSDEDPFARSIYFDCLGYFMVSYTDSLADYLHHFPLTLALIISSIFISLSAKAEGGMKDILLATITMLLSVVLGLAFPALFGSIRASLPGFRPMIWYSNQWIGYLMFMPMGLLGALLPQLHQSKAKMGHALALSMRGSGIAAGLIASLLHVAGFPGISAIFGWASLLSILYSLLTNFSLTFPSFPKSPLICLAAALAFIPVSVGSSVVVVFLRVIMERVGVVGDVNLWIADLIVGVLSGCAILASSSGVFLILFSNSILRLKMKRALVCSLLATSLLAAGYSAVYLHPYSSHAPKRTVISHIHRTELVRQETDLTNDGRPNAIDWWAATASLPPSCSSFAPSMMKVASSSFAIGGVDSNPISFALSSGGRQDYSKDLLESDGRESSGFFPVNLLPKGFVFKSPSLSSSLLAGMTLPHICRLRDNDQEASASGFEGRKLFELHVDRPGWCPE